MCLQAVFELQHPRSPDLNPSDFRQWGQIETPMYSVPIKMEHFADAFLITVKPFASALEPLKVCDSPCSDVSLRALIQVGDIFSIYCE
jgi:hypothetical protein